MRQEDGGPDEGVGKAWVDARPCTERHVEVDVEGGMGVAAGAVDGGPDVREEGVEAGDVWARAG